MALPYLHPPTSVEMPSSSYLAMSVQRLSCFAESLRESGQTNFETITDIGGATALHYAAAYGNLEVCHYLIEELNMDVNVGDYRGDTPLHYATKMQQLQAVVTLVEIGALLDKTDMEGMTPLHCACALAAIEGKDQIMQYLLKAGSNPNISDATGLTPLEIVARAANSEICIASDLVNRDNMEAMLSYIRTWSPSSRLLNIRHSRSRKPPKMTEREEADTNSQMEKMGTGGMPDVVGPNYFELNFLKPMQMWETKNEQLEMGNRLMGVDIGDRKVGLAVTDSDNHGASPLDVLYTSDMDTLFAQLEAYILILGIEALVVGCSIPYDSDEHRIPNHVIDFLHKFAMYLRRRNRTRSTKIRVVYTFSNEWKSTLMVEKKIAASKYLAGLPLSHTKEIELGDMFCAVMILQHKVCLENLRVPVPRKPKGSSARFVHGGRVRAQDQAERRS